MYIKEPSQFISKNVKIIRFCQILRDLVPLFNKINSDENQVLAM